MAKKKLSLILFIAAASFTALANNFSHISAPTLAESVTGGDLNFDPAAGDVQKARIPVVPIVNVPQAVETSVTLVTPQPEPAPVVEAAVAATEPAAPAESSRTAEVVAAVSHSGIFAVDRIEPAAVMPSAPLYRETAIKANANRIGSLKVYGRNIAAPLAPVMKAPVVEQKAATILLSAKKDVLGPLKVNARSLTAPTYFSPIEFARFEKAATVPAITAKRDLLGSLRLSARSVTPPLFPIVVQSFVAEQIPSPAIVRANKNMIGALSIRNRTVAPFLLSAPVMISSSVAPRIEQLVTAKADQLDTRSLRSRTIAALNISSPLNIQNFGPIQTVSLVTANADNFGPLAVAARTFAAPRMSMALMLSNIANAQFDHAVTAKNDQLGTLSVQQRTVSALSPASPINIQDFASMPVMPTLTAKADVVGPLAVNGRKVAPFSISAPLTIQNFSGIQALPNVTAKESLLGPLAVTSKQVAPFLMSAPVMASPIITAQKSAVSEDRKPLIPSKVSSPVMINGQTSFSSTMLAPLSSPNTAVVEPEPISHRTGGPSVELDPIPDSKTAGASVIANKSLPVMISGRTEFSTDLLKPMNSALASARPTVLSPENTAPKAPQAAGYCDASFIGEPIRFSQTVELRLEDLLSQLHARFGVNFIMGPNIGKLPLNVKAGSIPWNVLLRSQLFISGVRARCISTNTIELIENSVLPNLQDSDGVNTKFVKLKFLQRTGGGTVDLANRSQGGQNGGQGGCGGGGGGGSQNGGGGGGQIGGGGGGGQSGQTAATQASSRFDQVVREIEKILGLRSMNGSGGAGGGEGSEERRTDRFVTQIPGRNILAIRATPDEHELIAQIIERADRPPFQVVIKGLVYSANQNRIRDIGVNITAGNTGGRTQGSIFGDTLGVGTLFDFSTIIGTFNFNVQATAFQENGVISVKSRPFATVLDGLCTTLSVGTKLPIVIDSGALGGGGGITILNADNLLAVTPYVVDDENGNPIAVTLDLNLQANVIDSSITARGVPAINSKNIQTQLLLGLDKTAILGGFSIDQDSKTVSKVPGLGDLPIIGELFKRRIQDKRLSRLYFAIAAEVIPYGKAIEPVIVPGATTDPRTISEEMKKRAEEAEPKPVDPNEPYVPKKKKDN